MQPACRLVEWGITTVYPDHREASATAQPSASRAPVRGRRARGSACAKRRPGWYRPSCPSGWRARPPESSCWRAAGGNPSPHRARFHPRCNRWEGRPLALAERDRLSKPSASARNRRYCSAKGERPSTTRLPCLASHRLGRSGRHCAMVSRRRASLSWRARRASLVNGMVSYTNR